MAMNHKLLRPRASGGFDPRTISGLNLWLDFSSSANLVLDANGLIQEIKDQSGNGQHGTQTTAANRPTTGTINGKTVGDWGTGSNSKSLAWAAGANTSNWREVCIVAVWDGGGTTFSDFIGLMTGSNNGGTASGVGLVGNQGTGNWDTSFGWHTSREMNGVSTAVAFSTITSPFIVQFRRSSDVAVNGYTVGGDRTNLLRGWRGRIAEVLSYNRALTATELATIRTEMAKKWGITL